MVNFYKRYEKLSKDILYILETYGYICTFSIFINTVVVVCKYNLGYIIYHSLL